MTLAIILLFFIIMIAAVFYFFGIDHHQLKNRNEQNKNLFKAMRARHSLRSSDDFVKRLRQKFRR